MVDGHVLWLANEIIRLLLSVLDRWRLSTGGDYECLAWTSLFRRQEINKNKRGKNSHKKKSFESQLVVQIVFLHKF
jgi:hypothetical protein